jgi:hypothetical protein
MRNAANTLTANYADKVIGKLTGQDEAMRTEAVKSRMSGANIPMDAALAAGVIPTAVPGAIAKVGGGAIARGVTGALAAGAEGGLYGGLSASGADQPVVPGMLTGAGAGVIGQGVAQGGAALLGKASKAIQGIDDSLPPAAQRAVAKITGKTPPFQRVETAVNRAENRGGSAAELRDQFRELSRAGMSDQAKEGINQIVQGDPGTRAARAVSDLANSKVASGLAGASGITLTPEGIAAAAAIPTVGYIASKAANQGTQASVEALRRMMLMQPAYPGLLSQKGAAQLGRAGGMSIFDLLGQGQGE